MNLFSGSSFFGMRGGSRRPSHKRKSATVVPDGYVSGEVVGGGAKIVFMPKKEESVTEDPRWLKRGLFKVGFNAASPRLRGARKFTK